MVGHSLGCDKNRLKRCPPFDMLQRYLPRAYAYSPEVGGDDPVEPLNQHQRGAFAEYGE